MKRMQIPQKLAYEKLYVHESVAVDFSKIYFLKNAKKTCKSNNKENDNFLQSKKRTKEKMMELRTAANFYL